jgi:hypothetical protein
MKNSILHLHKILDFEIDKIILKLEMLPDFFYQRD